MVKIDPAKVDPHALLTNYNIDSLMVVELKNSLEDALETLISPTAVFQYPTIAALSGFARFVAPGGYLVVEDGVVDVEDLRLLPDWPRGVHRAIDEFLSGDRGREFVRRADLEPYGLTSHPGGYLQRRA